MSCVFEFLIPFSSTKYFFENHQAKEKVLIETFELQCVFKDPIRFGVAENFL